MKTLKLTDIFIKVLQNLPETSMGYHSVKVTLNNGTEIKTKVFNCEILIIDEDINNEDIAQIELYEN